MLVFEKHSSNTLILRLGWNFESCWEFLKLLPDLVRYLSVSYLLNSHTSPRDVGDGSRSPWRLVAEWRRNEKLKQNPKRLWTKVPKFAIVPHPCRAPTLNSRWPHTAGRSLCPFSKQIPSWALFMPLFKHRRCLNKHCPPIFRFQSRLPPSRCYCLCDCLRSEKHCGGPSLWGPLL